jgi:hypothetical protein
MASDDGRPTEIEEDALADQPHTINDIIFPV